MRKFEDTTIQDDYGLAHINCSNRVTMSNGLGNEEDHLEYDFDILLATELGKGFMKW